MSRMAVPVLLAAAGLHMFWLGSCSTGAGAGPDASNDAQPDAWTVDGNQPEAGTDSGADAATIDAGPDAGGADAADSGPWDAGADGGDPCAPVRDMPPKLTPDRIGFTEINPPATGSFIYLTVWGDMGTDSVEMLSPDGLVLKTRFTASRVWAAGAASDGLTLAFSSADPDQESDYGVTLGDAIQYTWIFEPGKEPRQLTNGNINDECHSFIENDGKLLMCRRANFFQCEKGGSTVWGNDPYRILTVDVATGEEHFLSGMNPDVMEIGPQLRNDGTIIYWRNELKSGKFVQSLMKMNGDGGGVEYLHEGWTAPRLSRDRTKVLFRAKQWTQIFLSPADDFSSPQLVIDGAGSRLSKYDFSPDMKYVVYSKPHPSANCDDIYTAQLPGGANQTLIMDCVKTGKNVVGLQWVEVK